MCIRDLRDRSTLYRISHLTWCWSIFRIAVPRQFLLCIPWRWTSLRLRSYSRNLGSVGIIKSRISYSKPSDKKALAYGWSCCIYHLGTLQVNSIGGDRVSIWLCNNFVKQGKNSFFGFKEQLLTHVVGSTIFNYKRYLLYSYCPAEKFDSQTAAAGL